MDNGPSTTPPLQAPAGGIGIVGESSVALQEIDCFLAREGIGISQGLVVPGAGLVAGLCRLQEDSATELLVVALEGRALDGVQDVLSQVKCKDKPTVVCLLGGDPRLVWRAGAIPARRLDEAALRAIAWVRNWDQALITSQLEEDDDDLAARAARLAANLGPARRRIVGLVDGPALALEARLMIAEVAGEGLDLHLPETPGQIPLSLRRAVDDPSTAAVVLSLFAGAGSRRKEVPELLPILSALPDPGPVVLVHLYGDGPESLARAESVLGDAGAHVMPSNAAAARLAGLVLDAAGALV